MTPLEVPDWKRKFIFLWKLEGKWIFCRYIWVRRKQIWRVIGTARYGDAVGIEVVEDYAFDDFELLQKASRK